MTLDSTSGSEHVSGDRAGASARLRCVFDRPRAGRAMEVHNGLSALIVEQTSHRGNGVEERFDALWLSSLTDSASRARPDNEYIDRTGRLMTIEDIVSASELPLIIDVETGGTPDHLAMFAQSLERVGVAALAVEDKCGTKVNSLSGALGVHRQLPPLEMAAKIDTVKQRQRTPDFVVVARIESFIAGETLDEAIERAVLYREAGADALLIHSRSSSGNDVLGFASEFGKGRPDVPLVCVPTTYAHLSVGELGAAGFSLVIYANHMLRAALPAMQHCAETVLRDGSAGGLEDELVPVQRLLDLGERRPCRR